MKVKGKKLPVTLFEVVDPGKREAVRRTWGRFSEARSLYYKGEWKSATALLKQLVDKESWDGPAKALYERCAYFVEQAPETWDGSYEMKSK